MHKRILLLVIAAIALAGTAIAQAAPTGRLPARRANGLADKQPDLPAGLFTRNPLWLGQNYATNGRMFQWAASSFICGLSIRGRCEGAGCFSAAPRCCLTDWVRAEADQLAVQGFVAVAPDLYSGMVRAAETTIRLNFRTMP